MGVHRQNGLSQTLMDSQKRFGQSEMIRAVKSFGERQASAQKERGQVTLWCTPVENLSARKQRRKALNMESQRRLRKGQYSTPSSTCCGADKYIDPANELCEREQPKQYEGTKVR